MGLDFKELASRVTGLASQTHADKIKLFAWFLHTHQNKQHFQPSDIGKCYDTLHLARPTSFGGYFENLVSQQALLKSSNGYRLETRARESFDGRYAERQATIQITTLLQTLPQKIPNLAERTYLNEALVCYRNGALRAAVVMTWNLTYHHLCDYILRQRLAEFNARWIKSYPGHHKKEDKRITSMDDFSRELKESEVITISRDADIITKDVARILDEKLGRRNSAAHPSSVQIGQLAVDAFIEDLVTNVVLTLC